MTPKEKAKELYIKYCPYDICYCDPLGREIEGYYERYAKTCALICVNEIIDYLISTKVCFKDHVEPIGDYKYYLEVKEELEKL